MDSEIVLNSVYYLAGLPDLIATGAVAVPPINVPTSQMTKVYVGVVGGLPLAVLLAGGVVILARRRKR
jgi:LPXTG-motif cell wall-anchored protein